LPGDLLRFASHFPVPAAGRYVSHPARTDERGLDWLPPKPFDLVPYALAAGIAGAALGWALKPGRLSAVERR
jgi:hypothetical protein